MLHASETSRLTGVYQECSCWRSIQEFITVASESCQWYASTDFTYIHDLQCEGTPYLQTHPFSPLLPQILQAELVEQLLGQNNQQLVHVMQAPVCSLDNSFNYKIKEAISMKGRQEQHASRMRLSYNLQRLQAS